MVTTLVSLSNSTLCKNTSTIKVGVQKPFKYIAADDTSVFAGQSATLWYLSNDTLLSTWTPTLDIFCPNCSSSEVTPKETTKYNLVLRDYYGCYELDTFLTIRIEDNSYLFVPDAFTPNGDGKNDVLYVRANAVDEFYFALYNRWGQKVFETRDLNTGWDGFFQGRKSSPDVFGYILQLKCLTGGEVTRKGNVTLIR